MRKLLPWLAGVLFAVPAFAQTISPANPVVNQGQTQTFVGGGGAGTFSCSGCAGSVNASTGVYTAPSTVTPQQSLGGYQLLPNNHIFNTDISGLSGTTLASVGTDTLGIAYEIPINYFTASTPTTAMVFQFTSANNQLMQIANFPNTLVENGWYGSQNIDGQDHHIMRINETTGVLQEQYDYFPIGSYGPCPTCNSESGAQYTSNDYALPANGATDAAGLYMQPLLLRVQETENACNNSSTINHALRITLNPGFVGTNAFIWPATSGTSSGAGAHYFGERWRLKSTFDVSGYTPCAQIILNALKHYGTILADNGAGMSVTAELGAWPAIVIAAFQQINSRNISYSNFELVDESSLMITSASGEAAANQETVCYTLTAGGAKACTDVIMRGVAVGVPVDNLNVMAGTPPQQLTAYATGGATNTITWTMSPSVGTLTSGGLWTPPAITGGPGTASSTDTFIRTNSGTLGANWTNAWGLSGAFEILSNQAANITGSPSAEVYTAVSQCANCFVRATVAKFGDADTAVLARASTSSTLGYGCGKRTNISGGGTFYVMWKASLGGITQLGATSTIPLVNGDIIEFQAYGSALTCIVNGLIAVTATDSTYSTGYYGIRANSSNTGDATYSLWAEGPSPIPVNGLAVTMTATSVDNLAISAIETINLCPNTGCYFLPSNLASYTDTHNITWVGGAGIGISNLPADLGCCSQDNQGHYTGPATDNTLFYNTYEADESAGGAINDEHINFLLPQGNYQITFNAMALGPSLYTFTSQGAVAAASVNFESQNGAYGPFTYQLVVGVGANNQFAFNEMMQSLRQNVSSFSVVPTNLPVLTPLNTPQQGLLFHF